MGKRAEARRGRRRGHSRGSGSNRRRPLAHIVLAGLGLAAVIVGGGAALASWQGDGSRPGPSGAGEVADVLVSPRLTPTASLTPKPPPSPSARAGASKEPAASPSVSSKPPRVPASGPGTFTTARTHGDRVGSGPLRRYRVQVEEGIDISASEAAAEIEDILAHPRSWAAHGRGAFQLVSSNADFVIRIATPATADRLCLAQGLNTHGELNCETVDGVVVNLRRWVLGSPTFGGPPADYRHLIINHEVGHEIGIRQHLGCSGPGKLAPVMMQQIKGLNGCRANAWPYDASGTYLTGPPV
ncbi:DUF3152 domain-containing protein [Streptomyces sp. AK02-01A]|uniref:DUF3152 domain-containing protein n=1 Tax=Streptomyces sp. AK02-01A TaxID=3028648 RepID=UPI0029BCDDD2|nr:DUF3152 domain-containing protein [Streptomyces sp. AK02-01A]MDX3854041.1 DUF3152 domain-containing protein [Streptomyces sp. AK02-01A]